MEEREGEEGRSEGQEAVSVTKSSMKYTLLTRTFFNELTKAPAGRPAQEGTAKRGEIDPESPGALEGEPNHTRTRVVTRDPSLF